MLPNTLNIFGAHYVGESLKNQVPSESPHRDGHSPFYEGNHGDDHLSCFPLIKPFPLDGVPNAHVWGNIVFGPKILHTLLEIN